jgi:hypothetical protein
MKHDLPKIKAHIKHNAAEARELRDEAQGATGPSRWHLQQEARDIAPTQRYMLLAYGYLRGKTIDQMESDHSDPDRVPHHGYITIFAHAIFNKGPDGEALIDRVDDANKWAKLQALVGRWWPGAVSPTPKPDHNKVIPGWEDFETHVKADLIAWKARLTTLHLERMMRARQVEVA